MDFLSVLIHSLHELDQSIGFPEPKDCIFRINRDIRFSPDKTPYKTNFGAYIARGGRKSVNAGYYFHIEPGGCFAAGGIYMPSKETLKSIREAIHYEPEVFRKIINNSDFKRVFGELDDYRLKTAPQSYSKDDPDIDLLRYTGYSVSAQFPEELVSSSDLLSEVIQIYRTMKPLNDFLNKATLPG
jgi:uncharacterized protein (TIGR02453 family)